MNRVNLMTLAFVLLLISTFPLNYGMIVNNNNLFAIGMILIIGACLLYSMVLFSILYKRNDGYRNHPDFNIYYDIKMKRNYWVLGYFGGGAIPVEKTEVIAREYARNYNIPYDSVVIDEILNSRRFKGFKYIYSQHKQTADVDAEVLEDVFKFLTD